MRELTPPNLDRILIQIEEGRKSHARKGATNNKKKAQGRTPTHRRKVAISRARGRGGRGATRRVQGGERGGCTFPTTKTTYGEHFKFFFNTLRL